MGTVITLADIRSRVRLQLQDKAAAIWDDDILDESIWQALSEYDKVRPVTFLAPLTWANIGSSVFVNGGGCTIPLYNAVFWSAEIMDVLACYTVAEVRPLRFSYNRDVAALFFPDEVIGESIAAEVRFSRSSSMYAVANATFPLILRDDEALIVTGACGFAATSRAIGLMEQVTRDKSVPEQVQAWGESKLQEFRAGLGQVAGQMALIGSVFVPMPQLDRWDSVWS